MIGPDIVKGTPLKSEVVNMPRPPGLGRRAVTQIQLNHKKNSYNSAVCKSQENLVKVRHSRNFFRRILQFPSMFLSVIQALNLSLHQPIFLIKLCLGEQPGSWDRIFWGFSLQKVLLFTFCFKTQEESFLVIILLRLKFLGFVDFQNFLTMLNRFLALKLLSVAFCDVSHWFIKSYQFL